MATEEGRVLIGNLHESIDTEVTIKGWVDVRRDHGKLIFLDIRDRSGKVQAVALPNHDGVVEAADQLRSEWVVAVTAKVNKRPEKMVNADEPNGDIELEILSIEVLSEAEEIPFDKDAEVNLDTYLDHLPYTLRSQRGRDIFALQATLIQAYRWALISRDFTEFQSPALVGEDAEGGAAAFKVEYYHDKNAYLATSPQLYKEIMTGPFERVFTVAKIFRGEKHATTRHLSEITQLDFEMAFIKDHTDVMQVLEDVVKETVTAVAEKHQDIFERFDTDVPKVGSKEFPRFTLLEAQEVIEKEFGGKAVGEQDLDPEHERNICEYALKEYESDFVFITHFPTAKRAFYTYPDPENPKLSYSFDLLFRGLEINSGSQRFHNHDQLVEVLKERGLDPEKFTFYLQMHKYGIPPHGGCSTGLERMTARMLELPNVKQATTFPRDMNRIDTLLSE